MSVSTRLLENSNDLQIIVEGRFDFSLHKQFRDAYADNSENVKTFTINLSQTTYMDSSALGMILLLKDYAEKNNSKIVIYKPNESIQKILEIAQFNRLMDIIE